MFPSDITVRDRLIAEVMHTHIQDSSYWSWWPCWVFTMFWGCRALSSSSTLQVYISAVCAHVCMRVHVCMCACVHNMLLLMCIFSHVSAHMNVQLLWQLLQVCQCNMGIGDYLLTQMCASSMLSALDLFSSPLLPSLPSPSIKGNVCYIPGIGITEPAESIKYPLPGWSVAIGKGSCLSESAYFYPGFYYNFYNTHRQYYPIHQESYKYQKATGEKPTLCG